MRKQAIEAILYIVFLLVAAIAIAGQAKAATLLWSASSGTVDGYGVYYWRAADPAPATLEEARTLDHVGHVHTRDDAAVGAVVDEAVLAEHPQWPPETLGARMYDISPLVLQPGADYQFAVSAYNAAGESALCDPATYTVPGYAPPDARLLENDLVIPAGSTIIVIQK